MLQIISKTIIITLLLVCTLNKNDMISNFGQQWKLTELPVTNTLISEEVEGMAALLVSTPTNNLQNQSTYNNSSNEITFELSRSARIVCRGFIANINNIELGAWLDSGNTQTILFNQIYPAGVHTILLKSIVRTNGNGQTISTATSVHLFEADYTGSLFAQSKAYLGSRQENTFQDYGALSATEDEPAVYENSIQGIAPYIPLLAYNENGDFWRYEDTLEPIQSSLHSESFSYANALNNVQTDIPENLIKFDTLILDITGNSLKSLGYVPIAEFEEITTYKLIELPFQSNETESVVNVENEYIIHSIIDTEGNLQTPYILYPNSILSEMLESLEQNIPLEIPDEYFVTGETLLQPDISAVLAIVKNI